MSTAPASASRAVRVARAAGEGLLGLVGALLGTLAYLKARPKRLPAPRLGLSGAWEGLALALLAVGLVAAAMVLVDPLIPGLRPRLPRGLVAFSDRLTDLGLGTVILWPLGLALLYVLALQPRLDAMGRRVAASLVARLGFLFMSIATIGLTVAIVKHLLGRARPQAAFFLPGPNAQLTFDWLAWKSSFASFPSGHSTTVFATAVAFAALYPRARSWLIALAVAVAATRVVLGSHYPSDVIAGAAIGTGFVLGMVKLFAARRVVFAVAADGRVLPMAGPSARRLGKVLFPKAPGAPNGVSGGAPLEEAR